METGPIPEPIPLYAGMGLTPQELQVCRLVCGLDEPTVEAVAYAVSRSIGTVHRHMEKLHDKLGVHTRGGLMRKAIELGIVNYCCAQCMVRSSRPPPEPPSASGA